MHSHLVLILRTIGYIDEVDELQVNNNADSIADRLGKASNSRVTLILNNGTVIGDSYIDQMELASLETIFSIIYSI